jgi:hypothetical protein
MEYVISGGGAKGPLYAHARQCHSCRQCPGWGDGHGTDQAAAEARENERDCETPSSMCQQCGAKNYFLVQHLPRDQQEDIRRMQGASRL